MERLPERLLGVWRLLLLAVELDDHLGRPLEASAGRPSPRTVSERDFSHLPGAPPRSPSAPLFSPSLVFERTPADRMRRVAVLLDGSTTPPPCRPASSAAFPTKRHLFSFKILSS